MAGISEMIANYWPKVAGGASIVILSWGAAVIFRMIARRYVSSDSGASHVQKLILSTVYYLAIILGLVTGLSTMGVKTAPIVAGLGLSGFALGFAFKDIISNLLAGVLILIYRPFKEGDYLQVSGCEGHVTEINMRYTVLRKQDTTHLVPNGLVFSNPLQLKAMSDEMVERIRPDERDHRTL